MYPPRKPEEYRPPSELKRSVVYGFINLGFGLFALAISRDLRLYCWWFYMAAMFWTDAALIRAGLPRKLRLAIEITCIGVAGGIAWKLGF